METAIAGRAHRPVWQQYDLMLALYTCVAIGVVVAINLASATDYVGADNDDAMRLVQVRDLLAGQNWFDLTQYRLGMEGGTLMHWSRLVDLPIAALILFFDLFLDRLTAEALALAVWPLLLIVPLMAAMGFAGLRTGGAPAMHVAFGLMALWLLSSNRFLPGAIDHHNVQLVLIAVLAAMLVDPRRGSLSFAIAGAVAACAIAIGAETMPLVAAACGIVAVTWAVVGRSFGSSARAFAATLVITLLALFAATVPPRLYAVVACDSISFGYVALAAVGGGLLFVMTLVAGARGLVSRFALVGGGAVLLVLSAVQLAPACLRSPLADLDPMLASLWLENVGEAQSIADKIRIEPGLVASYYAVGLFAIAVCVFRIIRRDRVGLHATMLGFLVVAWGIALVQTRGAIFANLLAIVPLSLLIVDLRANVRSQPRNTVLALGFLASALMSVPAVWFLGGMAVTQGAIDPASRGASLTKQGGLSRDCSSEAAFRQLAMQAPTTVAAPWSSGGPILRFTGHRALTGPYHRNQAGMLAEFHIGLASPDEAPSILRNAAVGLIAFCQTEGQTRQLIRLKPDGLYGALARGEVPSYLEPLPTAGNSGIQLYRVELPPW